MHTTNVGGSNAFDRIYVLTRKWLEGYKQFEDAAYWKERLCLRHPSKHAWKENIMHYGIMAALKGCGKLRYINTNVADLGARDEDTRRLSRQSEACQACQRLGSVLPVVCSRRIPSAATDCIAIHHCTMPFPMYEGERYDTMIIMT